MDAAYEYSMEALAAFRNQETDIYYEDFNNYMNEIDILGEAYIKGKVMMEDVAVDDDKTGRNVFGQILDFIKRIIAKFIDTAKNLFKTNSKWFSENVHKFDAIPDNKYSALKLTILPYWKVSNYEVIPPKLKTTDSRLGNEYKTSDQIEDAMYPQLLKSTVSNNITEGAKIAYRGGSNNLEAIEGNAIKERVTEMIRYCNGYVNTANSIKEELEGIQKQMSDASDELDKAMENYSIAEGVPIFETVYGSMPWVNALGDMCYITEAVSENGNGQVSGGNNNQNTNQNQQTNQKPDGNGTGNNNANKNPGSKQPDGNGTVQKAGQEEIDKKEKDSKIANKSAIKIYYQVYIKVATAMMTIAEERYLAYIRTLKSVLASTTGTTVNEKK